MLFSIQPMRGLCRLCFAYLRTEN